MSCNLMWIAARRLLCGLLSSCVLVIVLRLVAVEDDRCRVAVAGEQSVDEMLLGGGQPSLSVFVVIVFADISQIFGEQQAHVGVVFAQHLVVDVFESVGVFHGLQLFEILAFPVAAGRREHSLTDNHAVGDMPAHGKVDALFSLRAFGIEAKQVARTNFLKVKSVFHDTAKIAKRNAESNRFDIKKAKGNHIRF